MSSMLILRGFSYTFQAISIIFSLGHLYSHFRKRAKKRVPVLHYVCHLINIVFQIYTGGFLELGYQNYKVWAISWLFFNTQMSFFSYLNLSVLTIFSSIDSRIDKVKIRRAKWVVFVLYILFQLFPLARTVTPFFEDRFYSFIEQTNGIIFAMLNVLYDNIQAIYLTLKISHYTSTRKASGTQQRVRMTIIYNLMVSMIDWLGIGTFVYQIYGDMDNYDRQSIQLVGVALTGFHLSSMFLVFHSFAQLLLEGEDKETTVFGRATELVSVTPNELDI